MHIKVSRELIRRVGVNYFKQFDISENSLEWNKWSEINLRRYSISRIKKLLETVKTHTNIRGVKLLTKDLETWIKTIETGKNPVPRKTEQFCDVLINMLLRVNGHRVFMKNDVDGNAWLCYYVEEVKYHPEVKGSRSYDNIPEHVKMDLKWEEFEGQQEKQITFWRNECTHMKPEEALARKGIYLETKEMRKQYLKEIKKFKKLHPQIGKQYLAIGIGTDDCDGNSKRENTWWYRRENKINLERSGEPSRMVIDVFWENDKEDREQNRYLDTYFWISASRSNRNVDEDDEKYEDYEHTEEEPKIEIPTHPFLACFDLKRQLRLKVHVNYLTEYIYDKNLGEKLILPQETTDLVDMLIHHKGVFKDIIKGKGGGVIVLCTGSAGTGKTLTAEVYSEVTERPLYSIQASQLGTNPDELEDELMKIFARSQRWNAILLLDEADVYVQRRANSLKQNAIVGVFLRVLEYYNGVMFMTSNRGDEVDDAIASRCVARIEYAIPTPENQKKIWKVLTEVIGCKINEKYINEIVEKNPELSGRDVKNLIKLGKLVSESKGKELDAEIIAFVKRFKPTKSE